MDFSALAAECAPLVHNATISAVVQTESAGNPWAIGINNAESKPLSAPPSTREAAVRTATQLIQDGYNIDMGLAQINSANLSWLGLTVEQIFDPCTNLRAAEKILTENYIRAGRQHAGEQERLAAALSAYNTGDFRSGIRNGYVGKIYRSANGMRPEVVIPAPAGTVPALHSGARRQGHIAGNVFGAGENPPQEGEKISATDTQTHDSAMVFKTGKPSIRGNAEGNASVF